jgi:hypothetical protein
MSKLARLIKKHFCPSLIFKSKAGAKTEWSPFTLQPIKLDRFNITAATV